MFRRVFFLLLFIFLLFNCASAPDEKIYRAAITGDKDMLKEGLEPAFFKLETKPSFSLFNFRGDVNVQNESGNTALMWAIVQNNNEVVDKLLEKGAKVAVKDKFNKTTLWFAHEAKSSYITALTIRYKEEIICNTLWQKFKGLIGLRECKDIDPAKDLKDDLDYEKHASSANGKVVTFKPLIILRAPPSTKFLSDKNLLKAIIETNKDFRRYFDLAKEKPQEKDYQKMAANLGELTLFKIRNYRNRQKPRPENECGFSLFKAYDESLSLILKDVGERLNEIDRNLSNDPNAPLNNIVHRVLSSQPVEEACFNIVNDPAGLKKYDRKILSSALGWCWQSITDTSKKQEFEESIKKLGDPTIISELEDIKKRIKDGKFSAGVSLPPSEQKVGSLTTPGSQKYRLAVLTFIDQTQSRRGELVRYSIADILTSELFRTERFALVDRDDLVQIEKEKIPVVMQQTGAQNNAANNNVSPPDPNAPPPANGNPNTIKAPLSYAVIESTPMDALRRTEFERNLIFSKWNMDIDGFLLGYITSVDFVKGHIEVDYRIVYPPFNKESSKGVAIEEYLRNLIVLSGSQRIKITYDERRELINFNRQDIEIMANDIRNGFVDTKNINSLLLEEGLSGLSILDQAAEVSSETASAAEVDTSNGDPKKKYKLKVMNVEDPNIIINAGSAHGLKHGFVGYVIGPGKYGTYRYLSEFVVEQVFEKAARCVLIKGSMSADQGNEVVIK